MSKLDKLRVAIVHDWFDQIDGGSEKVAAHIANLFPQADIFTLLFNQHKFGKQFSGRKIQTSFLQKLPLPIRSNHHLLLPLIPLALSRFDFSDYDLVISSSPAFSKNISTPSNVVHITYCHSPMRFAWDYWPTYLDERELSWSKKTLAKITIPLIRKWDLKGAQRIKHWIANSETVKSRITKYYGVNEVSVLNPPVDLSNIPKIKPKEHDYYVTLATLASYKQIDLAIKACNLSRQKLFIIGDGPQRQELENIAGDTITFLGYTSGEEKWQTLANAKALIFPTEEDFGMAPIESLAVGTPVLAYKKGGLTETIKEGKSGFFFEEQTSEAVVTAMEKLESSKLNEEFMKKEALQYDQKIFDQKFIEYVESVI